MAFTLALGLLGNLVVVLFLLICFALGVIILLQKGRGGGLGAAFGGGGAGSLLGTKTGDFLTWVTITLVAGFLVLAVLMGKFMRPSGTSPELSAPMPPAAEMLDVDGDAAAETAEESAEVAEETAEPVEDEAAATEEMVEDMPEEADAAAEAVTETTE
ncbi:MAG: preprotein translocase subunit SecG [Planctomycetota bacterium]